MFERFAKDVSLSTVYGKGLSAVWSVVYWRLHADRYEWIGVVVILTIDVGVGGDFWVDFDI